MTSAKNCGRGIILATIAAFGITLLSACGSRTANLLVSTSPISITLIPSTTAVTPTQPVSVVTATVFDQNNQGAIWTVSPPSFGSLSNQTSSNQAGGNVTTTSIVFTAPRDFTVPTTVTITATSITNPDVSSSVKINASPVIVALATDYLGLDIPFAPQTISPNGQLTFNAQVFNTGNQNVTWSLSPASGAGSLANPILSRIFYNAPATVSGPITAQVTAASVADPNATATITITVLPSGAGPNVALAKVDGGPVPGRTHTNGAFTSVTLCNPGSGSVCQVVDDVLIDTGSYGLRVLQSAIPFLKLPKLADSQGNTLASCAAALDGAYLWGPVSQADVYIAGERAPSQRIQVITSSNATQVPDTCSNGAIANENTPELLGANGVLGIGPEPTDCTVAGKNYCDGTLQPLPPNLYYSCPPSGCLTTDTAVIAGAGQQITNPVVTFDSDKNGVILDLPAVSSPQHTLQGTLVFGIGTLPNNQLGTATILTTDAQGHFTTVYNGQNLTESFIDSGAPALFFPDAMPVCMASTGFFCPTPSATGLVAVNQGATQGTSTVNFSVDNADSLFATFPGYAAVNNLAGLQPVTPDCSQGGAACSFDWGLPFFYGRRVYSAIDGQLQASGLPKAPWWAY